MRACLCVVLALPLWLLPLHADDGPKAAAKKLETERKARQKKNKRANEQLAARLSEALAPHEKDLSGAVLVCKDGVPLYRAAFGMADRDGERKNTLDTLFDTGSVTKPFTATAVLKLRMQRKLALEDRLDKHFKKVPDDKAGITIHQLLSHTSGISRQYTFQGVDTTDRAASVVYLLSLPLSSKPGEKFEYSNANYFLAAAIVELASGTGFEDYCRRHLFQPAGLVDTGFTGEKGLDAKRSARRYEGGEDRGDMADYAYSWSFRGATGVVSTAEDMIRWSDALLGDGVLDRDARAKLFEPVRDDYACGWYVMTTRGGQVKQCHSGAAAGARCYFARVEEVDAAYVILLNDCSQGSLLEFTLSNAIDAVLFDGR